MGQMTTPKPLINIISWTCQEMMVWMSMELIGSEDVILSDFGLKVGELARLILVISADPKSDLASLTWAR
jgi:hypothetical protein